jgi:hypothetical protein
VVKIAADVLMAGAPATMTKNRHLTEQGRTPPPAEHRYCLGGSLLYAIASLGLPLRHDVDICLLIGLGPPLFQM